MSERRASKLAVLALIIVLGLAAVLNAAPTRATATDAEDEIAELSAKIEEASTVYNEACAELEELQAQIDELQVGIDELQAQIDETQGRIDEIEAALPAQREHTAASIRTLYKLQQDTTGLVELVLSSESFYEFISTVEYLDIVSSQNAQDVQALVDMENELEEERRAIADQHSELEAQQDELEAQHAELEAQREAAADALAEARAARQAAQDRAAAQAAAEAAQREAARQAAAQAAAEAQASGESATFTTESGETAEVQVPEESSPEIVSEADSRDAFVQVWAPRIDAYLAGSAMAGYGTTFAEAAWDYGVDPRWSPAIACIESGLGRSCFRPYNAWGWGHVSWSSWEEAIRAHIAGLSYGYGYTISVAAAQRYCPPTWQEWYSAVLSEMESI